MLLDESARTLSSSEAGIHALGASYRPSRDVLAMKECVHSHSRKVVLVTGAGRRVGAVIATCLHEAGFNIAIHCNHSRKDADALCENLNIKRADSAAVFTLDLKNIAEISHFVENVVSQWGRLDAIINNASIFYPTPTQESTHQMWDDFMNCHAKAPFFLCLSAFSELKKTQGCVVNITDINAFRPLKNHAIYNISKASLNMMTKTLAKEWGEYQIRVNAVAPGAVIWPEGESEMTMIEKKAVLNNTPLQRQVSPESIAKAVLFLLENKDITGEIIRVSAGRN